MYARADAAPVAANLTRASAVLKAMGNGHRLMVLCHLLSGERSVGELERIVGLSQSALSQHLARLRREALVKTRRQAQTIFYSLDGQAAARIIRALAAIYAEEAPAPPAGAPDENGTETRAGNGGAPGRRARGGAVCG